MNRNCKYIYFMSSSSSFHSFHSFHSYKFCVLCWYSKRVLVRFEFNSNNKRERKSSLSTTLLSYLQGILGSKNFYCVVIAHLKRLFWSFIVHRRTWYYQQTNEYYNKMNVYVFFHSLLYIERRNLVEAMLMVMLMLIGDAARVFHLRLFFYFFFFSGNRKFITLLDSYLSI